MIKPHLEALLDHTAQTAFGLFQLIIKQLGRCFPLTYTVFLRKNIGEAFVPISALVFCPMFIFGYYTFFAASPVTMARAMTTMPGVGKDPQLALTALEYYTIAVVVMCIVQGWRHWLRFWTDGFVRRHSMDPGEPLLARFMPKKIFGHLVKTWHVTMFVEPAVIVVFGTVAGKTIGWPFGGYFVAGGIMLFLREVAIHSTWREQITGIVDHDIEARNVAWALKHRVAAPKRTATAWGQVVEDCFAGKKPEDTVTFDEMVARLDPKVREVVTPPDSEDTGTTAPVPV